MVHEKDQDSKPAPVEPQRRRGRPRGLTAVGEATRQALFDAAIELMNERGFDATTLREVGARAGVTHAVLYRHFPSKSSVVMALYERLSLEFASATELGEGPWRSRVLAATRGSLRALKPHRRALRSALGVLVSAGDTGLFGASTRASRLRVRQVFIDAVEGSKDAPKGARAALLGRTLDLVHLAIVLFWLLDGSRGQRATQATLEALERALPLGRLALRLPGAWGLIGRIDRAVSEGLLGES